MSFAQLQLRGDTAANWTSANPVLAAREMALETDTSKFKIGNGSTAWNSLGYGGIVGPTGPAPNAFLTVTGNSGTATADTSSDSLAITGSAGIVTTATDNPEVLGIAPTYGTTASTITQGNDTRVVNAVQTSRSVSTTAPLTGGGALSGDLTLALTTTPAGQTPVGSTRTITTTAPLTIDAGASADLSANRTLALTTSPTGQTPVGVTRTLTGTAPITIDGGTSADLSANRTVAITAATASVAGSMAALDKKKLDNLWVDVTATSLGTVTPAQTAAQNVTGINAILSAAPSGSTIFFPFGEYSFNAAWTWPSKFFYILGQGQNRSGGDSELKWTSNVSGSLITLTDGFWYSRFTNITFSTTVDQTAGYAVQCGNNVGINFQNCSWQSAGGFFNSCIGYDSGANSGNSCFVDKCIIGGFKGTGIRISSAGTSVVISDTQVLGQWGPNSGTPAAAMAAAGISGGWVGALQINDCDVIGCVNNLLLNPVTASSEVAASVFCTNTYFDNSGGSCVKIVGTGATVRCRFDTCSFTTAGTNFTTAGTGLTAVEIGPTFAYGVGGTGIDFVNCNVFNTFSTAGTTNGYLISGIADFSIGNNRVAGWTNGVQVTPMSTAGRTQCQINNNTIGQSGGIGANSVGILLNAGAATYGDMVIESNVLSGNTTPVTDNSAISITAQKSVQQNPGTLAGALSALASGGGSLLANAGRGAVTSTTVETFLATFRIPGGAVSVGDIIQITALVQATGTGTGTFTARVRCGTAGTIAGDTLVNIAGASAASTLNSLTIVNFYVYVVALGSTATVCAVVQGTSTAAAFNNAVVAEALGNVVTTGAWFVTIAGTSSVASHTVRSIKARVI